MSVSMKLTNEGKKLLYYLATNQEVFLYGAIGRGSTPPSENDTALEDEIFKDRIYDYYWTGSRLVMNMYIPPEIGAGQIIKEIGIYGFVNNIYKLFFREVLEEGIEKTEDMALLLSFEVRLYQNE